MKTSESLVNIAPAMVKAQAAIESVTKDKVGKIQTRTGAGYEYKYSDLAAVIAAVKGPLNDNGIAFVQSPSGDASGVFVTTTLLHTSGEWISETVYMPVAGVGAQAYGSAITYAKRYGLQSMAGLPSEDDDGEKASKEPQKPNTAKQAAVDEFDALPEGERKLLQEYATVLIDMHGNGEIPEALRDYVKEKDFTHEHKMALWSLLPSNVRAAIKKSERTTN